MEITVRSTIILEDIIESLDHESAEELIMAIDLSMADYDFTFNVAKRFVDILKSESEAVRETFDISELG